VILAVFLANGAAGLNVFVSMNTINKEVYTFKELRGPFWQSPTSQQVLDAGIEIASPIVEMNTGFKARVSSDKPNTDKIRRATWTMDSALYLGKRVCSYTKGLQLVEGKL
jgi:hypothetical protein